MLFRSGKGLIVFKMVLNQFLVLTNLAKNAKNIVPNQNEVRVLYMQIEDEGRSMTKIVQNEEF